MPACFQLMPAGSSTERERGAGEQNRVEIDEMLPRRRGQCNQGLRSDDGTEPENEPRKLDRPRRSCCAAAPYMADDHEHRRQKKHAQHLGDHCSVARRLADRATRRQRLGYLMHGGAGVDSELAFGETSQRIEDRIRDLRWFQTPPL